MSRRPLKLPADVSLSSEDRRVALRMLELSKGRVGRLLVLLVEFDGHPLDRAAAVLGLTIARARDRLRSVRILALTSDQLTEREQQIAELAGISGTLRKNYKPSAMWNQRPPEHGRSVSADAGGEEQPSQTQESR